MHHQWNLGILYRSCIKSSFFATTITERNWLDKTDAESSAVDYTRLRLDATSYDNSFHINYSASTCSLYIATLDNNIVNDQTDKQKSVRFDDGHGEVLML